MVSPFDELVPVISDMAATPMVQVQGESVSITCTVTDNIIVEVVKVNITGPPGFTPVNTSMNHVTGSDTYYYESSYNIVGTYDYYIWATDTTGNGVVSEIMNFANSIS